MRILVTGGAGFIGSHIVDSYLKAGHKVTVVDNFSTGFKKNLNPKAKFYEIDIRNAKKISDVFSKERPEVVNHLAAVSGVAISLHDPMLTFDTNVTGTINILLAGGKYRIKKFIFPSTGGTIYGEPKKLPADETTELMPLSPYALSKNIDEICIKFYARNFGFRYLIFRYANVYGPRQDPKGEAGAVAIFGRLMKGGLRPTIFGDGTKTRDYIHIDDVVRANILALRRGKDETLNLGLGKEISDQMVFDAIARWTGFKERPVYVPFRKGEVKRISITNYKAKKILGWKPEIEFTDGIKKTLQCARR